MLSKRLKGLLKKAADANLDPYLALLDWRNTPSENLKLSPAQLMFGRRTRTLMLSTPTLLKSMQSEETAGRLQRAQEKQSYYYDKQARQRPCLSTGQTVRVKIDDTDWRKAEVEKVLPFRSYVVRTEDGSTYRRNAKHVRFSDEPQCIDTSTEVADLVPIPLSNTATAAMPSAAHAETAVAAAKSLIKRKQQLQQPQITRSGRIIRKPTRYQ